MSIDGNWEVTYTSQLGVTHSVWTFTTDGSSLAGYGAGDGNRLEFSKGKADGDGFEFEMELQPKVMLKVSGTVDGDTIAGGGKISIIKAGTFEGKRVV